MVSVEKSDQVVSCYKNVDFDPIANFFSFRFQCKKNPVSIVKQFIRQVKAARIALQAAFRVNLGTVLTGLSII